MKNIFRIISVFFIIIWTVSIFTGCDSSTSTSLENSLSNWMKNIKDETLLNEIIIPGSHDSGSYNTFAWQENQLLPVAEQLNFGVRYLDFRIIKTEDENLGRYENIKMYHLVPSNNTFYQIALEIREFIDKNPSEFIIFDFQSLTNKPYDETIAIIEEVLSPESYALKNNYDISSLTMGQIRNSGAKYIIIWSDYTTYNSLEKDYLFYRHSVLNSPYAEGYNTASNETLINDGFEYYYNKKDDRLFILQAQRTGTSSNYIVADLENSFVPYFSEFTINLRNSNRLYDTNIIMRDYINAEKSKEIIELNLYKKTVNENNITFFQECLSEE